MTFNIAVPFNYSTWVLRFPEFSNVSQPLAQLYYDEAALFCANSIGNIVPQWQLPFLLNLLTAHLAWLYAPRDELGNPATTGTPAPMTVGQIVTASEGSVSVGNKANSFDTAEWYAQTKYGYEYWQATASKRTMRYFPHQSKPSKAIFPSQAGSRWWVW